MDEQKAPVSLLNSGTLLNIGARAPMSSSPERAQWTVNRPPFVHDTGRCYLVVAEKQDGYMIAFGRQGMCTDIYTEASVSGIAGDQVDATVRWLWTTGTSAPAQPEQE